MDYTWIFVVIGSAILFGIIFFKYLMNAPSFTNLIPAKTEKEDEQLKKEVKEEEAELAKELGEEQQLLEYLQKHLAIAQKIEKAMPPNAKEILAMFTKNIVLALGRFRSNLTSLTQNRILLLNDLTRRLTNCEKSLTEATSKEQTAETESDKVKIVQLIEKINEQKKILEDSKKRTEWMGKTLQTVSEINFKDGLFKKSQIGKVREEQALVEEGVKKNIKNIVSIAESLLEKENECFKLMAKEANELLIVQNDMKLITELTQRETKEFHELELEEAEEKKAA